jgi:hypothetical protein
MHALKFGNGSSIKVGTSTRGLTEQYLHVSELGKISLDFPKKAQEIKTGAFNTVHPGQLHLRRVDGEGRGGVFFELCEAAPARMPRRSAADADLVEAALLPVVRRSACALSKEDARKVVITDKDKEYFAKVEAEMGVELSREQRAWYVEKAKTMGDKMKEEFPSTPKEPFEVPLEGTYFGKEMVRVRAEGRIQRLPWMPRCR